MEIKETKTQRILSPTQINLGDYAINPYKGCALGCLYCYVQQNKNIKNKKKEWGDFVEVKTNASQALKKELLNKNPQRILIGSTTECFQYVEKKYGITSSLLKILNEKNIPYTILTKSTLIKDYLDIIAGNKKNKIYYTFNVSEQKYINILEKKSPSLDKRLATIKEIIKHKIGLRIHIGPYIPFISSLKKILEILPAEIKEFDIELYHKKMGNFNAILKLIENKEGSKTAEEIKHVYAKYIYYYGFAQSLKKEVEKQSHKTNSNFYFILPEYNQFYKSNIDYYKPIK